MFMGWRMADDLETLAALPSGRIHIDLLNGSADHSVAGPLSLHIAGEIQAWLSNESQKDGIDLDALTSADLWVDVITSKNATNKNQIVSFDFAATSRLTTDETEYSARVADFHQWVGRLDA